MTNPVEPITITLTPRQWARRSEWLRTRGDRKRNSEHEAKIRREAMRPEHSKVVPAMSLWVCHGPWEYGNFDQADADAGFPIEVIWRKCPPEPVIGWRIADDPQAPPPAEAANLILQSSEFSSTFTDSAFGDTPDAAVLAAQRSLVKNAADEAATTAECEAVGHALAGDISGDAPTCKCGDRIIKFVEAEGDSAGPE